ncbi:MAG: glutathione S-transferase [Oleiphilus sp.]|nr:MAG: glutathione S-transferase [Oleiphilus sp.]
MPQTALPILYSFRRCPYAIRARMAIVGAHIAVTLHEVSLKDKPQAMLDASRKGTVPVLCLPDHTRDDGATIVMDESLDIMLWALNIHDPEAWLSNYSETEKADAMALIHENDSDFKTWLDRYKYADRFPEHSASEYRAQCETFLAKLEQRITAKGGLISDKVTLADIAIFPFVRQFSMVDQKWFDQCHYPALRNWLNDLLTSPLFVQVMAKKPPKHGNPQTKYEQAP